MAAILVFLFVCLFVFLGFFFWCGTPYSTTVEYFWLFNSWDSSYIGLSCLAYHNRRAFTLSHYLMSHFVLFGSGLLEVCSFQKTKREWSGVDLVERKDGRCRGVEEEKGGKTC